MNTICIDFDGVIHAYREGWKDGEIYDQPVPNAFAMIKALMADYAIVILSTRRPTQIESWWIANTDIPCITHYMAEKEKNDDVKFWNDNSKVLITRTKLPAFAYIDDRALTFKGNWGNTIIDLQTFKTWQE